MDTIQLLVESGVPYPKIADRFKDKGVTVNLLKVWANRLNWVTPFKLEERMNAIKSQVTEDEGVTLPPVNKLSGGENDDFSKPVIKLLPEDDRLTVLAEQALKAGKTTLAGFVHRAAPVLDRYTPSEPETIGEASILLKMLTKAAGLDSAQQQQTNVQVNVVSGPWGRNIEHSFQETSDDE